MRLEMRNTADEIITDKKPDEGDQELTHELPEIFDTCRYLAYRIQGLEHATLCWQLHQLAAVAVGATYAALQPITTAAQLKSHTTQTTTGRYQICVCVIGIWLAICCLTAVHTHTCCCMAPQQVLSSIALPWPANLRLTAENLQEICKDQIQTTRDNTKPAR